MKKGPASLALAATSALLSGCAGMARPADLDPPGSMITLQSDGQARSYYLQVPVQCSDQPNPCPVLLALHGGEVRGVSGQQFVQSVGLIAATLRRRYILVAPDAINRNWNDGRPGVGSGQDDSAFIFNVLNDLSRQSVRFNSARLFVTGISNGGHMGFRLACERPERFAAVAPVAASLSTDLHTRCRTDRPVSLLHIVGDADPILPFAGGTVPGRRGTTRGSVTSASETLDFWKRVAGCHSQPRTTILDHQRGDTTRVRSEAYENCRRGSRVTQIVVLGGGHVWPGTSPGRLLERWVGSGTQEIDATETILDFFDKTADAVPDKEVAATSSNSLSARRTVD